MRLTPFRLGLAALLATLGLDQATKLGLYFGTDLVLTQPWRLASFAEFLVVWNRGVSYGMFQQEGSLGRWVLVMVSCVAAIALILWMRRAESRLLGLALGLVAGGAIGNASDRAAYISGEDLTVDGGFTRVLMSLVPRGGYERPAD